MGRLLFQALGSTGSARQWARPASDVSAGAWTASTGLDLYAMLDEVTADDADGITSSTGPFLETATMTLGAVVHPLEGIVTIHVRAALV